MFTLGRKRSGIDLDYLDGVRDAKQAARIHCSTPSSSSSSGRESSAYSGSITDEDSAELSDASSYNSTSGSHDTARISDGFANEVEELCEEKFRTLTVDVPASRDNMRKALAAILMEKARGEGLEVVALATGTKCVPRRMFTCDTLIDCHAEVLARRAFKRWLYEQLRSCERGPERHSVLYRKRNGKFGLQEGVHFHLYVSTTPCGDAREFCNKDKVTRIARGDNHPNRIKRAKARCKLDCGDGSVHAANYLREGARYVTMSCSDKIAQWNVVGLQGALLSLFLDEPIYLKSIVVGWLFSPEHLHRALYSRISHVKEQVTRPFTVNKPSMLNPPRQAKFFQPNKTSRYSIAWSYLDHHCEMIDTKTGNLSSGNHSELSKRRFYASFLSLWDSLASPELVRLAASRLLEPAQAHHRVTASYIKQRVAYCDLKQLATGYQETKRIVHKHYNSHLGAWVEHGEVDCFKL